MQLILEAILVGIILVLVSTPIMALTRRIDFPVPEKYYIATFVSGIIVHLLCEFTGLNKLYCREGSACKKALEAGK
jgi:hypothetical protein